MIFWIVESENCMKKKLKSRPGKAQLLELEVVWLFFLPHSETMISLIAMIPTVTVPTTCFPPPPLVYQVFQREFDRTNVGRGGTTVRYQLPSLTSTIPAKISGRRLMSSILAVVKCYISFCKEIAIFRFKILFLTQPLLLSTIDHTSCVFVCHFGGNIFPHCLLASST